MAQDKRYISPTLLSRFLEKLKNIFAYKIHSHAIANTKDAGFVKLYTSTGNSIDGAITQKAFTDILNKSISYNLQEKIIPVTFLKDGWEGSSYYFQNVKIAEITSKDTPMLVKYHEDNYDVEKIKAYNKAFGKLADGKGETLDGSILWKVSSKPEIDITVGLKVLKKEKVNFTNAKFDNMKFGTGSPEGTYFGLIEKDIPQKRASWGLIQNGSNVIFHGDFTIPDNSENTDTLFMGEIEK